MTLQEAITLQKVLKRLEGLKIVSVDAENFSIRNGIHRLGGWDDEGFCYNVAFELDDGTVLVTDDDKSVRILWGSEKGGKPLAVDDQAGG